MGRPSTYSEAIAAEICERLAAGESLKAICRDEHMPPDPTVRRWVIVDEQGFAAQYVRARDIALDRMADEIVEIADNPQIGEKIKHGKDGTEITEGDMIEHRRLRVDARKWYLCKLAPKRYGDRLDLGNADGQPLQIAVTSFGEGKADG
jgi:hypothetical protein